MTVAHDHADPATTQALAGFNGMVGVTFIGQPGEQQMHSSDVAAAVDWNSPSLSFASVLDNDERIDLSALSFGQPAATAPAVQAPTQVAEGPTGQENDERKVTRRNDFGFN